MSVIKVSTVYGNVVAKDLQLVDIHDVQPMADEESINNSTVTATNKDTEVAEESCCDLADASDVDAESEQ